ncbi:hypothetical protein [Teredinibacter franksiae]|uniref:hypothetical protein n=1 Tax=Teredinibacter franksiae TaxID=2761453 RepID=UPI001626D2FA|nr:hypothetical protein [Teredinibacter franksiae]
MEIDEVAKKSAVLAIQWFDAKEKNGFSSDVNFDGLGFCAANNARDEELPCEERLLWAELSNRAYSESERRLPESERGATELSQMNLRACLILSMGQQAGHKILDANVILDWLFCAADKVGESKLESYLPWHEKGISRELMLDLRAIKNRLNVCELLYDKKIVESERLEYLLKIKKDLP